MKRVQGKAIRIIVNAAGELLNRGLKHRPFLIKPNHHELSALLGREPETVEETADAARSLMDTYGIRKAVVSVFLSKRKIIALSLKSVTTGRALRRKSVNESLTASTELWALRLRDMV